jgi:hypothetical protein
MGEDNLIFALPTVTSFQCPDFFTAVITCNKFPRDSVIECESTSRVSNHFWKMEEVK